MISSKAIPSTVYYNATTASNDENQATLFNQYFLSIFNQVNSDIPEPDSLILHLNPISHIEIPEACRAGSYNKTIGLDGNGTKVLRNCALSLYQPLSHLFNERTNSL